MSFFGKDSCFLRWGACLVFFVALSVVQLNAGYLCVDGIELTKPSEFSGVYTKIRVTAFNYKSEAKSNVEAGEKDKCIVVQEDPKGRPFDHRHIADVGSDDGTGRDLSFALPGDGMCAIHVPAAGKVSSFWMVTDISRARCWKKCVDMEKI